MADDEIYVSLGWDSGPYAQFHHVEKPGIYGDGTAIVKRELWERYKAAEALVMRLQDEIEAARIPKGSGEAVISTDPNLLPRTAIMSKFAICSAVCAQIIHNKQ